MAYKLQLKRGLTSALPTGSAGEPLFTTDTNDLYIGTGAANQRYQKYIASGTSSQFLKGDGSLDSNTYYLASNPSAYIALTALSASSPLSYNNTSGAFTIAQASGSANGYLSSTDWTTFNNKQNALTNPVTGTGTSGQVTYWNGSGSVTGSSELTYNNTNGSITLSKDQNAPTSLLIKNLTAGGSAYSQLELTNDAGYFNIFKVSSAYTPYKIIQPRDAGYYNSGNGGGDFSFLNDSATGKFKWAMGASSTAQMTLTAAGRLLLGTTAESTYILEVVGTARISSSLTAGSFIKSGGTSSQYLMADGSTSTLTNPVTGTGTTNYLPKWTSGSALGNSLVYEDATNIGINTSSPTGFGSTYTVLDVYNTNSMLMARSAAGIIGQINAANTDALYIGTRSNHKLYLTTNNTNVVAILTNGNVGIGVDAPDESLVISKSTFPTLKLTETTASNSIILQHHSSTNEARLTVTGAYPLVFKTTDTERMRLTSTGLGIGTTSPATSLEVQKATSGVIRASASDAPTTYYAELYGTYNSADLGGVRTSQGNLIRYASDTSSTYIGVGDTVTLKGGNLGIGVTPSAWASDRKALQVGRGGSFVAGTSADFITITSNAYYNGTNNIYIANGTATQYVQTSGTHWWSTAPSGTAGGTISFTQAMTLDASGRLGLGTTSPSSILELYQATPILTISATTNNVLHGIEFKHGGSIDATIKQLPVTGEFRITNGRTSSWGGFMTFYTDTAERLRITSGGNVGVNCTATNAKLEVVATSGEVFRADAASGAYRIVATQTGVNMQGNVGINTLSPAASSLLDVTSTTQGFLPPRMTTTQKNAISSPAAGLIVFDTTLVKLCVHNGTTWETITSL